MTDALDLHDRIGSYASGTSTTPLIGSTIGDLFDRVAASVPDNDALISCHQNLRYTYRQLRAAVDRCARGMMALGIHKGDCVRLWSPTRGEWVLTLGATA